MDTNYYDDIVFEPGATLHRVYDILPYTHWQIKKILKALGLHLEPIGGYKCNRVPNYKQHYRLIKTDTGEVVNPDITNDTIRRVFARKDIPLDTGANTQKASASATRNPKAELFMAILKAHASDQEPKA